MVYDFDTIVPRRQTNSYKWDSATDEGVLPMWVADMDFRTAPEIIEALQRRVAHGIFGYTHVPDAYYQAVQDWFERRHAWRIRRESILYTTGVVPALSALIKALTMPGERVLVQTPVYNCFFSSIRNNGCEVVASPLLHDGDSYRMDFEDLERKAADERTRVMLLCNPHNPVGRAWREEELRRLGEICLRHHVFVISDEIHGELTMPGYHYTPFATLGEEFRRCSATCVSPTKAFNLAGLQIANIIVEDEEIRYRTDRAINIHEVCDVNPFGVEALIAAYRYGAPWLDALNQYLAGNYRFMKAYCDEYLPRFPLARLEATYLVWMDCNSFLMPSERLEKLLLEKDKLWLNAGAMYGEERECHLRWNIACPRQVLKDGLDRFRHFVLTAD